MASAAVYLPIPESSPRLLWITQADDIFHALDRMESESYDAVVAAFPLHGWTPEELLEETQRRHLHLPIVIQLPAPSCADAVRLARLGAWQVFGEDCPPEEFDEVIESAAQHRRSRDFAPSPSSPFEEAWKQLLIGRSQSMEAVRRMVGLVGQKRSTVLICGETGTGKEMVARAIHMASNRARMPLVAVNCAALPENLLEAELFGHVKGAFTGAFQNRVGRFEQANRGTLFLDEIGDMPLDIQAKLLRVLQEREFQRIGSSETVRVDVRVIAATNVELSDRIRQGRFREDLFYRLNVVPIPVPPLRERLSDVPLLAQHFVEKICRQEDIPAKQVAWEAMERLMRHDWPGNVRQLENSMERAIALSGDREILFPGDFSLPAHARRPHGAADGLPLIAVPDEGLDFEQTVGTIERALIEQALHKSHGCKKKAADMLHMKRTTLGAKLKALCMAAGE